MKKIFQAKNINCKSCANTIKVSLEDDFGDIEINLNKEPKEVSVELKDIKDEEKFKSEMKDLGFEVIKEI